MPLHDWKDDRGWDGVHLLWLAQLIDWVQPRLPAGYRAFVVCTEPDQEVVATFTVDPQRAVHIDRHGQLIAAIEIISPRNKDRPDPRARYLGRYAGYLRQGVHLLLVDVLPRPDKFSFADAVAADLGFALEPCPAPYAVSYRVGEPVPEGTLLAFWRRPLAVGRPLPTIPLALDVHTQVDIDLEHTYREAARRVYLD